MVRKIISSVLVSSFLLQIMLTSFGCKAFYPLNNDDDLLENVSSKNRLLLKLKDQSELDLEPETYLFVDKPSEFIYGIGAKFDFSGRMRSKFVGSVSKDEIVSMEVILIIDSTAYYRYLLKDSTRITFQKGKIYSATPDSGSEYWIVLDNDQNDLRIINKSEIEEIQINKTNWIATSLLLGIGIGFIALIIVASQFAGFESSGGTF